MSYIPMFFSFLHQTTDTAQQLPTQLCTPSIFARSREVSLDVFNSFLLQCKYTAPIPDPERQLFRLTIDLRLCNKATILMTPQFSFLTCKAQKQLLKVVTIAIQNSQISSTALNCKLNLEPQATSAGMECFTKHCKTGNG